MSECWLDPEGIVGRGEKMDGRKGQKPGPIGLCGAEGLLEELENQ